MKQLTDVERLEVAMDLLDDEQVDAYVEQCAELEREGIPLGMKPLPKQDCERNGFHNTPAECEDFECAHCPLYYDKMGKKQIGCPYDVD